MAKYSREFLVPYLEDVCALYMCEEVLLTRAFSVQKEIIKIEAGKTIEAPRYPDNEETWSLARICGIVGSVMFIVGAISVISAVSEDGGILSLVAPIINIICVSAVLFFGWLLISTIKEIKNISEENTIRVFRYESDLAKYEREKKKVDEENTRNKLKLPQLRNDFDRYNKDLKKCKDVLRQVYEADVLPMQYRNKYAALYLYDYFKHSMRADDLDAAINTCVLEQIKEKLDEMIELQAQSIVNQRIVIANQRVAIEEQREHAAYMRQQVRKITANLEEQNQYLSMIESNTAATAFFASADYLRKS